MNIQFDYFSTWLVTLNTSFRQGSSTEPDLASRFTKLDTLEVDVCFPPVPLFSPTGTNAQLDKYCCCATAVPDVIRDLEMGASGKEGESRGGFRQL
jgi:hypothetical protein